MVLSEGRHRIGQRADCEVRLDDATVSQLHAELIVAASGVQVRDTASTNGVLVLRDRELGDGGALCDGDAIVLSSRVQLRVLRGASRPRAKRHGYAA